jgi:hypothetical protein
VACEKVTGGKCKVNWEMVCKPKEKGGLGILYLTNPTLALLLRWLWHKWNDERKPWVGLGNTCTPQDHVIFGATACVIVGNGKIISLFGGRMVR